MARRKYVLRDSGAGRAKSDIAQINSRKTSRNKSITTRVK
ncbi:unnamed protein product, partial [Rotaria magnacalcarata]